MNPTAMSMDDQGQSYGGSQPGVDPGTMGQMDVNYGPYGANREGYGVDSFDEEEPLLKELGIDMELIRQKVSYLIQGSGRIISVLCCYTDTLCTQPFATDRQLDIKRHGPGGPLDILPSLWRHSAPGKSDVYTVEPLML